MSIDTTNSLYGSFVKPFFPYLEKPYAYVKPYAAKADELGAAALTKFDETIPVLKKEPAELQKSATDMAYWPIQVLFDTKDYALNTYSDEYKKCGGDGVVAGGKALITSSMKVVIDTTTWLQGFFEAKKEQTKKVVAENTNN